MGVDVTVGVLRRCLGVFVCVKKKNQDPSLSIAGVKRVNDNPRPGCLPVEQTPH